MPRGSIVRKLTDSNASCRESAELYCSNCSLTALVEILAESDALDDHLAFAAGSGVLTSDIFESFAFVVCAGYVSSLEQKNASAVTLRPGSALPLCCRDRFTEDPDYGS